MTCLDDADEVVRAAPKPPKPTTISDRFRMLRIRVVRYGALRATEAGQRCDERPLDADVVAALDAIALDLAEFEAIIRAADAVMNANTGREKQATRAELSARLRRVRCWPEPPPEVMA